jgi:DNA primase
VTGRIAQTSIEEVVERADLLELASARTDLKRSGAGEFSGRCPFHDERTASFWVNPLKKTYYCFGCQRKGGVIQFVMETQSLGFVDAIETLAERYGVELVRERSDPADDARRARAARLHELLELAATFYRRYLLESPAAAGARAYVDGRGISQEVAERFGIGYAPAEWERVATAAQSRGFSEDELVAAGLARRAQRGRQSLIDLFRGRLMFPLCDRRGRVVALAGRRLPPDEEGPKYVNSPEGPIWRKGDVLYGLHLARTAIARANRALVVEGYTDVIMLAQAGVDIAVAAMGTSLTDHQLRDLRQLTRNVVLCFDADAAGAEAALRGMALAEAEGLNVGVAELPVGTDPADLAVRGESAVLEVVDGAVGVLAFRIRRTLTAADLGSAAGRTRALEAVAPLLASAPPSVERSELVAEVIGRLRLPPEIADQLHRARRSASGTRAAPARPQERPQTTVLDRAARSERLLLALALADPAAGLPALTALDPDHLTLAEHRAVLGYALRRLRGQPPAPEDAEIEREFGPELDALAAREPGGNDAVSELLEGVRKRALGTRVQKQRPDADKSDDEWREFHRLQAAAKGARRPDIAPETPA